MSLQALRPPCRTWVRLSKYTSLGLGGEAELFFIPETIEELREEVLWCGMERLPLKLLGGGTNVACRDETLQGAIISTGSLNRACHNGRRIRVQAGFPLAALVKRCCELGLSGLEALAGIPGTVGGAIAMNAGGKYGNIGPLADEVRTLTIRGEERVYRKPAEHFGYRGSNFHGEIITEAVLCLALSSTDAVGKLMRTILREKLGTQPLSQRSAGCVFKNPSGDSAGRLIDECGLKGRRIGGMQVSQVHANFIVNAGDGTFGQFRELVQLIKNEVRARFGVELELEVSLF